MTITINGTTGIAGVNGSAATPAVQGDDTNTGVFYPVADTVAISTGGTERMRVTSTGVNLNGSTSGTLTIAAPAVAGTNTLTLVAATETLAPIVSATAQVQPASPSAVPNVDFTGIPSWVKRVTVMINGIQGSGTSGIMVQVGATTFTTSGYLGAVAEIRATPDVTNFTTGFGISGTPVSTNIAYGIMTIANITGNTWVYSYSGGLSDTSYGFAGGGRVALSGTLDRVRLTTVNGTDTFTAGSVNIMYE